MTVEFSQSSFHVLNSSVDTIGKVNFKTEHVEIKYTFLHSLMVDTISPTKLHLVVVRSLRVPKARLNSLSILFNNDGHKFVV